MARIFDEKFEGAGYEEAWTEAVGAGCTIDEDADPADVSSPANWGSQCLKIIHAGVVANYTYAEPGDGDIRYCRIEIVFTDLTGIPNDTNNFIVAAGYNAAYTIQAFGLYAYNDVGTKKFLFYDFADGTGTPHFGVNIAINTLYRFEYEHDSSGNNNWKWKINGVSQNNGNLVVGHGDFGAIVIGDLTGIQAGTFYCDLIAFDDADWVGIERFAILKRPIDNYIKNLITR